MKLNKQTTPKHPDFEQIEVNLPYCYRTTNDILVRTVMIYDERNCHVVTIINGTPFSINTAMSVDPIPVDAIEITPDEFFAAVDAVYSIVNNQRS